MIKYYHGGGRGYQKILPASVTGERSSSEFGAGHVHDPNKVYLTTMKDAALMFASFHPSGKGVIYEVEPQGVFVFH